MSRETIRTTWYRCWAGCLSGLCLAATVHAGDSPSSPNNYGITRGKIPFSNHWGHPLKKLFTGPQPIGDVDRSHWYQASLRGDWHQHRWCDYMWSGDCYNDNWRTTTWHCQTKSANFQERLRQDSLAWERALCGKKTICQNGYVHDTSGTSMLNFFRCQSPCGTAPVCNPIFGGCAPWYEPYRFQTQQVVHEVPQPLPAESSPPASSVTPIPSEATPTLNAP